MKRLVFGVVLFAALIAGHGIASASWNASGSGNARSAAATMPTGNTPTTSVTGRNVTVSWTDATIQGVVVGKSTVRRFDASTSAVQTIGSACNGTVNGTSCVEAAVAPGTWKYAVTPVKANWVGTEGPKSATATVGSPSLTLSSPTTFGSLPTTLNGDVANYVTGETITFRLDNPNSGALLTGTVTSSPIPTSGASAITVTIPTGTSVGAHTVYAVGSSGASTASAGITVQDAIAPTVTASVIDATAGGNPGFIKQGTTYYVYANVNDPTPSSGINTVTANVAVAANVITTGQTAAALTTTGGPFTVGGTTYSYRSASLTANGAIAAGAKTYTVTATDVSGNSSGATNFSVAVDNTNPTVTASVIGKTAGGIPGFVKPSGAYYIYANATDATSGISTVTANVAVAANVITTGQTAVPLTSAGGPFTIGGVTYTYRSASVTADAGLTAGAKNYTITATDGTASNSVTTTFTVTGDNTNPNGTDIQTTNVGGGQTGRAETGDAVTYTYSEQMEPISVLAGWDGTSTTVTLRLIDGGGAGTNDGFEVWDSADTTQTNLESATVDLGAADYITGGDKTFTGSTMVQSGNNITVTLGTASGAGTVTRGSSAKMLWNPSASSTDRAGNACSTALVTETGNGRNF